MSTSDLFVVNGSVKFLVQKNKGQKITFWKHTPIKNDNLTLMLLQKPLKIPLKKQFINLLIKRHPFL